MKVVWNKISLCYKKFVISSLSLLNYNKIDNTEGNSHLYLNVIDLILALVYMILSMVKLNTVTVLVLVMNLLTLSRLIVGNFKQSIILREKYEEFHQKKPGLLFKSAHDIKLIIEFCVIGFGLIPFWFQGMATDAFVIKSFAGIIIVLSFAESYINIHAALFDANIDVSSN